METFYQIVGRPKKNFLLMKAGVDGYDVARTGAPGVGNVRGFSYIPRVGQNLARGQETIILDLETQAVVPCRNDGLCSPSEIPFIVSW